jgi:hypothetical protein
VLKVLLAVAAAAIVAVPAAGAAVPPAPNLAVAAGIAHRISPEAALAASTVPGATTEVAPGLTLRQAVGLDATKRPSPGTAAVTTAAATQCWIYGDGRSWDFWPFGRALNDTTSWCGTGGGVLTYRSSHFTQDQTLCAPNGTYAYVLAGGVGQTYVAWREGGYWSCASVLPYVTFHADDWMSIYINGSGAYTIYEKGGIG